jgi:IS30 family transposase
LADCSIGHHHKVYAVHPWATCLGGGPGGAGHWETDLIFGTDNSQSDTLVVRHTRYVMLTKMPGKESEPVNKALSKQPRQLPSERYKSLSRDRGSKMAGHKHITLTISIKLYFCNPQNSWQRGLNENTNGLLR